MFSSCKHPPGPEAYEEMNDGNKVGAALYLRMFVVRFAKRFPQQHGFISPFVDSVVERQRLIEEVGTGFQAGPYTRPPVSST